MLLPQKDIAFRHISIAETTLCCDKVNSN